MTTRSNSAGTVNKENASRRLKDKQEAERRLEAAAAESDKKREEEKKRRAEAKAKEEAEAKAKRDEERRKEKETNAKQTTKSTNVTPTAGINSIVTELATDPGVEEQGCTKTRTALVLREAEDSPEKKKTKSTAPTTSNLKVSRYSAAAPKVSPPPAHHIPTCTPGSLWMQPSISIRTTRSTVSRTGSPHSSTMHSW